MDLCVVYQNKKFLIELKLLYSSKTETEGLSQLSGYMNTIGKALGWLILFDRKQDKSWEEKIYWKTEKVNGKTIHVVGC